MKARGASTPASPIRIIATLVLAGVVLSALAYFGFGIDALEHVTHLPMCVFRALTGIDCPGCGMTRAFVLLGQLRLADAVAMHPLAPGLMVAIVAAAMGRNPARLFARPGVAMAACAIVLGTWAARLAG